MRRGHLPLGNFRHQRGWICFRFAGNREAVEIPCAMEMLFPECLALRAGGNGIKTGFKEYGQRQAAWVSTEAA